MNTVFLGPPGVGKGTQATRLAAEFGVPHISTGDILREEIKAGTELGRLAQSYIDDGNLVPDSVAVDIIRHRLTKPDARRGYILDGFPRTVPQAEMFEKLLEELGDRLDRVIYLEASEEVLVKRLSGRRVCRDCGKIFHLVNMPPKKEGVCDLCGGELYQRPDDEPESVRHRFRVYQEKTADLVRWYEDKDRLTRLPGDIPWVETYEMLREIFSQSPAGGPEAD